MGLLNTELFHSQGRANALYVLFYYSGGWLGITGAGFAYEVMGWNGVVLSVTAFPAVPLTTGLIEGGGNRLNQGIAFLGIMIICLK